jgi:tetratricopeptide (TPR) repeat protein
LVNLAGLYHRLDRFDEAEKLFVEAIAIDEKAYGANHTEVAIDLNNLAWLYAQQGKFEKAEGLILRALAIREATYGAAHPDVAESLDDLAELMQQMGRIDDAREAERRALDIRTRLWDDSGGEIRGRPATGRRLAGGLRRAGHAVGGIQPGRAVGL